MTADFDAIMGVQIDGVPNAQLLADLKDMILAAEAARPRSLQRALGPSSVAEECERKLGFMTSAARHPNPTKDITGYNAWDDPMASIIGTATHAWMEDAAKSANEKLGRIRWVPEAKVEVRPGLSGTCDLYDADTNTVLDWKFPGTTRYGHYVKHGPSPTYRGQAHMYGRGYRRLGLAVDFVGIIFVSRAGSMNKIHLWREPYNDELVEEILARIDRVEEQMDEWSVEINPEGFKQIPITPSDDCNLCPWFSPTATRPRQCNGKD